LLNEDGPEPPGLLQLPESASPQAGPPDLLTADEARALIRSASNRAPTGIRNRALIATMYRSGLRPGEALGLDMQDVDIEAGVIRVPPRKGGKVRLVGVDETTRSMIARWLDRREKRDIPATGRLFCTLAGDPLKAAYVRELLPRLARKAGIDKRVHPLGLRYANAAELSLEGFPTALIDRHLGVAITASARRYQPEFAPEEVVTAVASRQWEL
jgi:site-specific recombinase XerD